MLSQSGCSSIRLKRLFTATRYEPFLFRCRVSLSCGPCTAKLPSGPTTTTDSSPGAQRWRRISQIGSNTKCDERETRRCGILSSNYSAALLRKDLNQLPHEK